jgi:uncharacterized protein YkwD
MPKCEACDRLVELPFICHYCGGLFCPDHRVPESHNCAHLPNQAPEYIQEKIPQRKPDLQLPPSYQPTLTNDEYISEGPFHFKKGSGWEEKQKARKQRRILLSVCALVTLMAIALSVAVLNPNLLNQNSAIDNPSFTPSANPTASIALQTPSIQPQTTSSSTETYAELVNYALALINSDRQSHGLQNVTLSSVTSGQEHANEMLAHGYFSHWDLNGYKPYMRYTLAGGRGSVAENCAWMWSTGSITDIKGTLSSLEHSMMYDDASSNWGHRDNILEPSHNKVSIGIAYDRSHVYLVQDFEDDYVSWTTISSSGGQVRMQGALAEQGIQLSQVGIYYDQVSPLTTQQLSNSPYQGSYNSGTYVGQVLSPPPEGSYYQQPSEGILIEASSWTQTGQNFDIVFNLTQAFAHSGAGVYTLYLWTDSNTFLTTYSIWNP